MNDTISRQAAIDAHCELCPDKYICCPVRNGNICHEFEVFRLLPSAQPPTTNNTGKWLGKYCPYTCDQCGKTSDSRTPFCRYCGADMRERVTLNELSQKLWER